MEVQEIIKSLKSKLKKNGFVQKGTYYCKVCCDTIFSVQFQKRSDGLYNINLGIHFETDVSCISMKNVDIGWVLRNHDDNYFEAIDTWFNDRSTIAKMKNLYWSGKLGDFASNRFRQKIKECE